MLATGLATICNRRRCINGKIKQIEQLGRDERWWLMRLKHISNQTKRRCDCDRTWTCIPHGRARTCNPQFFDQVCPMTNIMDWNSTIELHSHKILVDLLFNTPNSLATWLATCAWKLTNTKLELELECHFFQPGNVTAIDHQEHLCPFRFSNGNH